ncbi:MAG: 50S ribosomal protein L4 [Patescibacteria group bacterium]|nr:50S ribosomal protein L4 [Patescibacteria group bacterium]
MKLFQYDAKTLEKSEIDVPLLWNGEPNVNLLSQAMHVYKDRSYKPLSKTKGRGEVKASTRKIYRQKGTGNARHGSVSAPIFVGGGIAHGPDNVKKVLLLPKAMRLKALESAYKFKMALGKLVTVSNLYSLSKTKQLAGLVKKLRQDNKNTKSILFVIEELDKSFIRIFRNLPDVFFVLSKDVNAYAILKNSLVVVAKKDESDKNAKTKKSQKNADQKNVSHGDVKKVSNSKKLRNKK